jgi:uncharacterized protein involved in exopolysaccharide biosynthesis
MLTPEVYASIQRRPLDMSDYIDVARRHRGWLLGPLFAGLVIGAVVAFALPNVYVSQASLRITPAQISEAILPSVVNQQMADRINEMQQDILSRTSLAELIQRPALDLYKKERDRKPLDDVIEQMRTKDVKIQVMNLGSNPQSASSAHATGSAFTVSFAYHDRYKAKAVVDALVSRFVNSNDSGQVLAGNITGDFVHDEVQQAKADLDRLNNELTEFRKENLGRLPEQLQVNVQALNALQSQRASMDEALNRDAQEKVMLEGKLDTLRSQKDSYSALVQQASDDPVQSQESDRIRDLNRSISEAETQLAIMQQKWTDTHPDVVSAKATIEALKKERDEAEKEDGKQPAASAPKKPSSRRNNVMVQAQLNDLQLMIDQTQNNLKALEMDRSSKVKQIDQVNRDISSYQGRLEAGPANEQKYAQLMSDQQQANQKYQELVKKQSLTDENRQAQVRKAGEQLEVLDPASLPESPTAPNRWLITGIGFGVGVILGLALTALREIKDTSLKNLKDVRAYTQLPILSSIPLLENDLLVQRRRRVVYVSWSAAVTLGVVAIGISMYYHFFVLRS